MVTINQAIEKLTELAKKVGGETELFIELQQDTAEIQDIDLDALGDPVIFLNWS